MKQSAIVKLAEQRTRMVQIAFGKTCAIGMEHARVVYFYVTKNLHRKKSFFAAP